MTLSNTRNIRQFGLLLGALLLLWLPNAAQAQDREVPYWASIRASATTLNMRVGPSLEFKIAWVYQRPGLPVKIVRVKDGWRLIEDPEGTQGWVKASLLSTQRAVYVRGDGLSAMRLEADAGATIKWQVEAGVVARLLRCEDEWCRIDVDGRRGWVRQSRLWGAEDF